MAKSTYWISDSEGVYAAVEGADERNVWTKVHGWHEAAEPGPTDQVHVINEDPGILPGRLPYAAVELHAGLGWKAGPPPPVVDVTKDPVLVDQPEPVKPKAATVAADKNGVGDRA